MVECVNLSSPPAIVFTVNKRLVYSIIAFDSYLSQPAGSMVFVARISYIAWTDQRAGDVVGPLNGFLNNHGFFSNKQVLERYRVQGPGISSKFSHNHLSKTCTLIVTRLEKRRFMPKHWYWCYAGNQFIIVPQLSSITKFSSLLLLGKVLLQLHY